jgi:WD40 repeat protein/serine/threonine protein kinase
MSGYERDTEDKGTADRGTEDIAVDETMASGETDQAALKDSLSAPDDGKPVVPGYELQDHLGMGSYGDVWSAIQISTGHKVAVKVLKRATSSNASYLEKEVNRLASVSEHPHVITLVDANLTHSPPYMVTPYIPDSLCSHVGKPSQQISQVVEWFKQIARALLFVHGKGILHCDLKPGNILLGEEGEARIVDFGQAHLLGKEGQSLGTLWYMPPEQALIPLEEKEKALPDVLWDVYSLGATIYYLLTGRLPRATEKARDSLSREKDVVTCLNNYAEELKKTTLVPLRQLNPLVDEELAAIVEKCLSTSPQQRYRTMGEILEDLKRRENYFPLSARPRNPAYLMQLFIKRHARLLSVSGALLIVLIAILIGSFVRITQERDKAEKARAETQQRLARMEFERGLNLITEGTPGGVLWMARALKDQESSLEYRVSTESHLRDETALETMMEGDSPFISAVFSKDGKKVLTASESGAARIWDAADGRALTEPFYHNSSIFTCEFSHDNRRILTASKDRKAVIWDIRDGKALVTLPHRESVNCAAFSPDDRMALTASDDGTARIWDASTGKAIHTLSHKGKVNWAAFSPDGSRIVTSAENHRAQLWDIRTGAPLGKSMPHRLGVLMASFSPDGKMVATASKDWTVRIWDGRTGEPLSHPLLHSGIVNCAIFNSDSSLVLSTSEDLTARVWSVKTGKPLSNPLPHKGRVGSASFSPDGSRVITASDDWTSQIWDTRTGKPMGTKLLHWGPVRTALFSPDGTKVMTASADKTVKIRDLARGSAFRLSFSDEGLFSKAAPNPAGTQILLCVKGKDTALVWDIKAGRPVLPPLKHDSEVNDGSFSPDGRLMATAAEDGTVRLWDAEKGSMTGALLKHDSPVKSVIFSPDGKMILSTTKKGSLQVWKTGASEALFPPMEFNTAITMASFSPDGKKILCCLENGTACLWDSATGQPLTSSIRHKRQINFGAFTPDGKIFVTASSDGAVCLWDSATGMALRAPMEFMYPVHNVSFSRDGRQMTIACDDGSARVWEISTGKPLSPRMRHGNVVNTATFSPDMRWVVTSSWNGSRVWDSQSGSPVTPWMEQQQRTQYAVFLNDSSHILTLSEDGKTELWSISIDEDKPAGIVELEAEVQTGLYLDQGGNVTPMDASTFRSKRLELGSEKDRHDKTCKSPVKVLWSSTERKNQR